MTPEQREHVELWLDALRSGKYKQGHGCLEAEGAQCCLGVACRVALDNGLDIHVEQKSNINLFDSYGLHPPPSVCDWLGIASNEGLLSSHRPQPFSLIVANDNYRLSFPEIADLIEDNYETLFGEKRVPDPQAAETGDLLGSDTNPTRKGVIPMAKDMKKEEKKPKKGETKGETKKTGKKM